GDACGLHGAGRRGATGAAAGRVDRRGHHLGPAGPLAGRRPGGGADHAQHARPARRRRHRPVRQPARGRRRARPCRRPAGQCRGGVGRGLADGWQASAVGTGWLDDVAMMDAVTGTAGSGPAYVFLLAEAMEEAAIAEGLAAAAARTLVRHTVLGAARMLVESGEPPTELRRRVTSPGGTTQAAIEAFEAGDLRGLVARAVRAATRRGGELSAAND